MKHAALRRYFRHGTLTQLAVFEAVARHGSFTRAAEELHLAQPTVSIQMKKLTMSLGLRLFEQSGRKIQVTLAGQELYASVHELFGQLGRLENRLAPLRQPVARSSVQEAALIEQVP